MFAANFLEAITQKFLQEKERKIWIQCWLCDAPSSTWRDKLTPNPNFPAGPRFGAYLRCIPPADRVGEYVHCTGRVVNIIIKRLFSHFPSPAQTGPISEVVNLLTLQSQGLPLPERLAPRHTKAGSLDLSASVLFILDLDSHSRIGKALRATNTTVALGTGRVNAGAAVEYLFRVLHALFSLWRQPTHLTPHQKKAYHNLATKFGELWVATGWKVSTWVHWVVHHSPALIDRHHNSNMFSSIPSERRNVEFKLDITHCYKGWKLSRPSACKAGFGHVLNLSALDIGLYLYDARRRGQKRGPAVEDDDE